MKLITFRSNVEQGEVKASVKVAPVSSEKRDGVWFVLALDENRRFVACAFSDRSRREVEKAVVNTNLSLRTIENAAAYRSRFRELQLLFNGTGNVKLKSINLSHLSEFRRRIYLILRRIPRGKVTTYGAIASKLGSRSYARAVGTAVASNPLPLVIPCHRVVPASLNVENYGMPGRKPSEGAYVKRGLLEREGVKFQGSRVSKESLWFPD